MKQMIKYWLLWIVTLFFTNVRGQAQLDYVTPILNNNSYGNMIFAAQHDSEIVFITNCLDNDSLITSWNGIMIKYLPKDSLCNYLVEIKSSRYVFEITKVRVTQAKMTVEYLAYVASRNGKKIGLHYSLQIADSIEIPRLK